MSTRPSTLPSYARLALIDRVPEELRMEVHDTVQDTVIKTIPKKRRKNGCLRRQVRWSGSPISLRIFYCFWKSQQDGRCWSGGCVALELQLCGAGVTLRSPSNMV